MKKWIVIGLLVLLLCGGGPWLAAAALDLGLGERGYEERCVVYGPSAEIRGVPDGTEVSADDSGGCEIEKCAVEVHYLDRLVLPDRRWVEASYYEGCGDGDVPPPPVPED
jgi:hypothetical protein